MNFSKNDIFIIKTDLKPESGLFPKFIPSGYKFPEGIENWNKKRQLTLRVGRAVLFSFLEKFLNINTKELVFNEHGKPFLAGNEIYFNLSHTDSVLYLMIAPYPIGIDVETIKARKSYSQIKEKILTLDEVAFLEHNDNLYDTTLPSDIIPPSGVTPYELTKFFWIWTIKETLVKVTGRGLTGLDDLTFLLNQKKILNNEIFGKTYTYTLQQNILSFYVKSEEDFQNVKFFTYDYLVNSYTYINFLEKPKLVLDIYKN